VGFFPQNRLHERNGNVFNSHAHHSQAEVRVQVEEPSFGSIARGAKEPVGGAAWNIGFSPGERFYVGH